MTQVSFNLFLIFVSIVVICVFVFLIPKECNKCFPRWKKLIRIVCFGLAVAIFLLMLSSIDYTGNACVSGEVKEIQQIGSFGGFYDRYRIKILDSNGGIYELQSILPVYGKGLEYIDDLSVGATVKVYGSTVNHAFFYSIETN